MKLRIEKRGLHYYDRVSGTHVLLDEIQPPPETLSNAPSLVSIALTNVCDLACSFCYAPKTKDYLSVDRVTSWCSELDDLGTLEVAFGGGEPTLYPQLSDLCRQVWSNTGLGISITTHGQHLDAELCSSLAGYISVVRISIDGVEDAYATIRGRSFATVKDNLATAMIFFPVAVNTVVNARTLSGLPELATILRKMGVYDWLLLPETKCGVFTLSSDEWAQLDAFIGEHSHDFQLGVTFEARPFLPGSPFLFDVEPVGDYVHISADGFLRRSSYERGGIDLDNIPLTGALAQLSESHHNDW